MVTLTLFPLWMMGTLGGLGVVLFIKTIKLMRAGEEAPLAKLLAWADGRLTLIVLFSMAIAGLNKIAFLWLKPALNVAIPFTADPFLADLDKAIFFGTDPWSLVKWANNDLSGLIYHPIWYFTLIGALIVLFTHQPSARKSAMALSYFLLWSVVGPVIHTLFPAGGPVFYERLGYGDRFAGIDGGPETASAAAYLWQGFTSGQFDVASGISAMPSLHVTMAVWTMLCVWHFARRWFIPVAISSCYVTILSVSLGWHYAVDGIVGGLCTVVLYKVLLAFFERNTSAIDLASDGRPIAKKGEIMMPQ